MTLPLILFFVASASMSFLWVRYLQTEVANNDATGGIAQISFKDPWMVFKYVSIGLFLVFLCGALLRKYLYYRWGIDCFRRGTRISPGQEHLSADQRRALELLEEEMAQKDMDARRQERRRKYEQFLAPYTMVSHNVEQTFRKDFVLRQSVGSLIHILSFVFVPCNFSR